MIDLHTHILPFVDDGAADVAQAKELLREEAANRVDKVFLTPHFDCEKESVDEFIERRDKAFALLNAELGEGEYPQLRLGAEVRYSPNLLDLELHRLTLGGSVYLLLELPYATYPTFIERVVEMMVERQIVPILAHVERCVYFRHHPKLLKALIDRGALAQVSAAVVMKKERRSFSMSCLRHSLAQFVASDAHNMSERPPCMLGAMSSLKEKKQAQLEEYAEAVWNDWDIAPVKATAPCRYFCKYQ